MDIREKLSQRLKAQGWRAVTCNAVEDPYLDELSITACRILDDGYSEYYRVDFRPEELTAEKAMQIETWFKERLNDE